MNISKFVVLGALEVLEQASGYDIIRFLEKEMVSRWINLKNGSVYNALKVLCTSRDVKEIGRVKNGSFPTTTVYQITEKGMASFDSMQEEAFAGLYPLYLGFKLGLKLNRRRSEAEIVQFGEKAVDCIDARVREMDNYLLTLPDGGVKWEHDAFFIEHDRMLLLEDKRWIQMAVERARLQGEGVLLVKESEEEEI